MATEDDNVNSGALATLLSVGAFMTLGIALTVTALVRSEMTEEAQKKEVGADQPLHDLVNEQSAKLNAPAAYVDRGKGLVSLPIERAMELTVSGLKKDPNSATPPPPKDAKPEASAAPADSAAAPSNSGDAPVETAPPTQAAPKDAGKPDGAEKKDTEKKDGEKKDKDKKDVPKIPKPAPVAPAPAAPAPAPAAPAPAPNGQ